MSWFCSTSEFRWGFLVWAVCLGRLCAIGSFFLAHCCMPHIPLCLECRRVQQVGIWESVFQRVAQVGFQRYQIAAPFGGIHTQCLVVEMMGGPVGSSGLVVLAQVQVSVLCPCSRVVLGRLALGHCYMRPVHFSQLSDGSTRGAVLSWGQPQICRLLSFSLE